MSELPILLTSHAQRAMFNRDITYDEVMDTVRNYRNRWASHFHNGKPTPDRYVYQGDHLAAVVVHRPTELLVLTVLLKSADQWTDEDARQQAQDRRSEPRRS